MDLRDLGTRRLSWRRLSVLVTQLPRSSRLAEQSDPRAVWSTQDYLLAGIHDQLAGANWQRGGGKGARPKPIPRPGRDDHKRLGKARPLSETRDLFDRWRRGELNAVEGRRSHIHQRKGVTHGN